MLNILDRADLQQLKVMAVSKAQSIIDWTWYDRQSIPTSSTPVQYSFFKEAFSGAVTLETTNMELAGQFQQQYAFVVTDIFFVPIPGGTIGTAANATDIQAVINTGYVQFVIGNRPFYQEKLLAFTGGGLHGFAAGATAADYIVAYPKKMDMTRLQYMPLIDGQTSFTVTLGYDTAPTVSANLLMYCKLKGFLIRPNLA